jgi:hypothetical protein
MYFGGILPKMSKISKKTQKPAKSNNFCRKAQKPTNYNK